MFTIAIISIFVFTGFVWLVDKFVFPKIGFTKKLFVCPICAGVSLTWFWLLAAKLFSLPIDPIIPAILLGGSVVGIAYQVEKKLPVDRSSLFWKVVFIPLGFIVAYNLIEFRWLLIAPMIVVLALITMVFLSSPKHHRTTEEQKKVEEIEKKMEGCC